MTREELRRVWAQNGVDVDDETFARLARSCDVLSTKSVPATKLKADQAEMIAEVIVKDIAAPLVAKIRALEKRVAALEQTK